MERIIVLFHKPQPYQLSLPAATAWQERFAKNLLLHINPVTPETTYPYLEVMALGGFGMETHSQVSQVDVSDFRARFVYYSLHFGLATSSLTFQI